jgi:hypothetical protein
MTNTTKTTSLIDHSVQGLASTMPKPIIILPIHTIEQARTLAGLLRAYIDEQAPDTNDGQDYKPDPDLAGMAALYAHLDAGIAEDRRRTYAASGREAKVDPDTGAWLDATGRPQSGHR